MLIIPHRRMIPSAGPTIIPGSASFTTPGVYNFAVPYFHSLVADVRGASGGGGGIQDTAYGYPLSLSTGGDGGYSYFNAQTGNLVGYGGGGGTPGYAYHISDDEGGIVQGTNGAHGSGVNGDYNGYGDATPGGAGAYHKIDWNFWHAGNGGNGARAYRTWYKGGPLVPKSVIQIVVGAGGAAGACFVGFQPEYLSLAASGVGGAVYLSWS